MTPKSVVIEPRFHTSFHTFGKGMEGWNPHECWGFHTFHTFHTFFLARARLRTHAHTRAGARSPVRARGFIVWKVWKVWKNKQWRGFAGSIPSAKVWNQVWNPGGKA